MKISKPEQDKIDIWVSDLVVIMNGSTFSDNNSYKETLTGLANTYIKHAYIAGKQYAGSISTLQKQKASRENGKKGGRPKTALKNLPAPTKTDKQEV